MAPRFGQPNVGCWSASSSLPSRLCHHCSVHAELAASSFPRHVDGLVILQVMPRQANDDDVHAMCWRVTGGDADGRGRADPARAPAPLAGERASAQHLQGSGSRGPEATGTMAAGLLPDLVSRPAQPRLTGLRTALYASTAVVLGHSTMRQPGYFSSQSAVLHQI